MTTTPSPWPLPEAGLRLNLGCQTDLMPGWVNVDRAGADVDFDLDTCRWPFSDDTVDFVLASHIVEHLRDFGHFMREAHRVLKAGGTMVVMTPAPQDSFWNDPTHVRPYTAESFGVYCRLAGGYQCQGVPCWSEVETREGEHSIPNNGTMRVVNARLVK